MIEPYMIYVNYGILVLVIALDIWMIEDAIKRTNNKWFFPIISILLTFLPFIFSFLIGKPNPNYYFLLSGVVIWLFYLLLRPEFTTEEIKMIQTEQKTKDLKMKYYEYELAKSGKICPVCGLPIETDYMVCPNCFKELREKCTFCGKLIDNNWSICPYCKKKITKGTDYENKNI